MVDPIPLGQSLSGARDRPMALPSSMRRIVFDGHGGPDVIRIGEAPVPTPVSGQVLIEVVAAGINRPDVLQRAGAYPPPAGESDVPGLEVSGRVVAVGPGVEAYAVGDEVCALLGSGGYAEYAVADASLCMPVPRGLSLRDAGGLPETYFTVFDNVFQRGTLVAREKFLVHGGSSGIGSTAIQLARAFGAEVFTTAGSADKCAFCQALGAHHVINYKTEDFAVVVREVTKSGVNLILDMVGGSYLQKNISVLATEGRLVQIAFLQSGIVENFDARPIMMRRLVLTGSTLRSRSVEQKAVIARGLRQKVWPLLETGEVKPIIHATFPLEAAAKAHEMMEASSHLGKILLVTGK